MMKRKYDTEEKERLIKKYKSGEYPSIKAFCMKEEIPRSTMNDWLKASKEDTDFALVSSGSEALCSVNRKSEYKRAQVNNIKMAFAGALLEVPIGFEKSELKKVLEVLGEL